MDIVLMGATGFVGSAVLRAAGANKVHVLVVKGDIRKLPKDVFPAQPHIVIHLATKQIDSDKTGFEAVNVEGTRRVVEGFNDATRGILYGSSVSVYGQDRQIDLDESAPLRPETPLAKSRARAEQIVLEAAAARGIGAYCLRPRFIFGRGDRHTMPGLTRMVRQGIQLGDGTQRYSIIDVDDYARVLLLLASRIETHGATEQIALNLAYTRPVTLNEIVSVICDEFHLPRPWIRVPVSRWISQTLRSVAVASADTLATRLELFGFSHTFRVDQLCARIGTGIPGADPIAALQALEADTRCFS